MRQLLVFLLFALSLNASAQQIARYEYWFDLQAETKQSGSVSSGDISLTLDVSKMRKGFHCITFRAMDDRNRWSAPQTSYFFCPLDKPATDNTISQYEYWIDSDVSRKVRAATNGNVAFDLDVTALHPGYHCITFRGGNKQGRWSAPQTTCFYVPEKPKAEAKVTAYRYWFNAAAADYTEVVLPEPQSPYTLDIALNTKHLLKESEITDANRATFTDPVTREEHIGAKNVLHIAFRDANNKWSTVQTDTFVALPAKEKTAFGKLSDVRLTSVSPADAWNELGSDLKLGGSANYAHADNQRGTFCYNIDNGATVRMPESAAAGSDYNFVMDAVFKKDISEHVIKVFALDEDGESSDTVEIKIPDMRNTSVTNVPTYGTYTGEPVTFEGLEVWTSRAALDETEYSLFYADNVNDGSAYITPVGTFPNRVGKGTTARFTIRSFIDKSELAVLKNFQTAMGGKPGWNFGDDNVYSNELTGIKAYNTHITEISLSSRNLEGELPSSIYALPYLEKLYLSNNKISGNIIHSLVSKSLNTLNISHNKIKNLTGLLTDVKDVDISYQTLDDVVEFYNAQQNPMAFMAKVPSIFMYDATGRTMATPSIILYEESNATNRIGNFEYKNGKFSSTSSSGIYTKGNGDVIYCRNTYGTQIPVKFLFDSGDANIDGLVNVLDLQSVIKFMYGSSSSSFNFTAADAYCDRELTRDEKVNQYGNGALNIQDIVTIVNTILADDGQPSASKGMAAMRSEVTTEDDTDSDACLYTIGDKVMLRTSKPVTALQIKAHGNVTWNLSAAGFSQTTRNGKVVAYSMNGIQLPVGETQIGTCTSPVDFREAIMSDSEAKEVTVSFGEGSATGINTVGENVDADLQIFGADGIRRGTLRKGLNIIRKNNISTKVNTTDSHR